MDRDSAEGALAELMDVARLEAAHAADCAADAEHVASKIPGEPSLGAEQIANAVIARYAVLSAQASALKVASYRYWWDLYRVTVLRAAHDSLPIVLSSALLAAESTAERAREEAFDAPYFVKHVWDSSQSAADSSDASCRSAWTARYGFLRLIRAHGAAKIACRDARKAQVASSTAAETAERALRRFDEDHPPVGG